MAPPLDIFCCYARKDQSLLNELKIRLTPLQRQGFITIWCDTDIDAGVVWEEEIKKHLDTAQIILLLISPDFMASEYCYSIEMRRALERHEQKKACVIPVILRPTDWKETRFDKLQVLPTNTKPVTSWQTEDDAFHDVALGIRKVVEGISKSLLFGKSEQAKDGLLDQAIQHNISGQGLFQDLEAIKKKFNEEMWRIYYDAKAIKYNSIPYLRLLSEHKGEEIVLAHNMLASNKTSYGEALQTLKEKNRLDLSVEALALKPEYASLFTEDERKEAHRRLTDFGYKIS